LISQKRVVFARGRQPESNEKEKGRPSNLCAAVPAGPRRPEGNDPKKGRSSSSPSNLPVGRAGSVRIVRGIRRDKERKIIGTAFERFRFALRFFFLAFFRSFVAQKAMLEGKANSRSRSIATPLHLHLRSPLLLARRLPFLVAFCARDRRMGRPLRSTTVRPPFFSLSSVYLLY